MKRKKMSKWYIELFLYLMNTTTLNSRIICRENSGVKKIDHLKLRIELVEALLIQHGIGVKRKVPGRHSVDNLVPLLIGRFEILGEAGSD